MIMSVSNIVKARFDSTGTWHVDIRVIPNGILNEKYAVAPSIRSFAANPDEATTMNFIFLIFIKDMIKSSFYTSVYSEVLFLCSNFKIVINFYIYFIIINLY